MRNNDIERGFYGSPGHQINDPLFFWSEPTDCFHHVPGRQYTECVCLFASEHHGGLARCQTPAAPGTGR